MAKEVQATPSVHKGQTEPLEDTGHLCLQVSVGGFTGTWLEKGAQCQDRESQPLPTTSAPNHNWPAKLSCRISSGNLTQKSRGARS